MAGETPALPTFLVLGEPQAHERLLREISRGFLLTNEQDYYKFVWIFQKPVKGVATRGGASLPKKNSKGGFCP